MPKMKTRKAVAKRIKVTGSGKMMRRRPMRGHLRSRKSPKRLRNLRQTRELPKAFAKKARRLMGI